MLTTRGTMRDLHARLPGPGGSVAIAMAMPAWTGFAPSTTAIAGSGMSWIDVAAIRYVVPAVLLAPL